MTDRIDSRLFLNIASVTNFNLFNSYEGMPGWVITTSVIDRMFKQ
jgi:hypothetical protein